MDMAIISVVPSHQALRTSLQAPTPAAYARAPMLVGLSVVAVALVGSALWAARVPLASAAVASGQVIVHSSRKTIQHLEGGIVRKIAVTEGQHVHEGDALVTIDDTQVRAQLDVVRSQYLSLKAREARLIAERDHDDKVYFNHPVFAQTDISGYQQVMDGQKNAFETRRKALFSRIEINGQREVQLQDQIGGLNAQVTASDRQLVLIAEELHDVQILFNSGNERKSRLLALQRTMAEISGNRGSYVAQISQARQQMIESSLKSEDMVTQFMADVVKELGEVQGQIGDLEERFQSLNDRVDRSVVRAPTDGTVVNLRLHTLGGVAQPGADLLDLVPTHDQLEVDAMVKPEDMDYVTAGLPATIRVTAFDQRSVPDLDGIVQVVSADRLEDKRTGAPYYLARIRLDAQAVSSLPGTGLQPGMPGEVMIKTGEQPLLKTLVSPILHSMNRAFRER